AASRVRPLRAIVPRAAAQVGYSQANRSLGEPASQCGPSCCFMPRDCEASPVAPARSLRQSRTRTTNVSCRRLSNSTRMRGDWKPSPCSDHKRYLEELEFFVLPERCCCGSPARSAAPHVQKHLLEAFACFSFFTV